MIDTMGERLQTLLSLDNIDDFVVNTPTELWTYTLNESGEELLKKSFIETALSAITITAMTATAGTKTKRKNRQTKSRQKRAFSQNYSVRRIKI